MINIIININTKFVFIYKVWFSTVTAFLKIAKLYFSFRSVSILKTYRLINRYRPVFSNLAIGIGKIQYRSTSIYRFVLSNGGIPGLEIRRVGWGSDAGCN